MGRFLAAAIALLAVGVFAVDLWSGPGSGHALRLSVLGEWWAWIHRDSLLLLQPALERHLSPILWDPVMLTLLETPLSVLLAILAAVIWLGARRRPRKRAAPLDLKKR